VPQTLGATAPDRRRASGACQAEALAIPHVFVLTHGALLHACSIAEGMPWIPSECARTWSKHMGSSWPGR